MTMRVSKLTTYLRAEDAYVLIDFLDQVRTMLMASYGDEIRAMLQEASTHNANSEFTHEFDGELDDELPF